MSLAAAVAAAATAAAAAAAIAAKIYFSKRYPVNTIFDAGNVRVHEVVQISRSLLIAGSSCSEV